MLYNIILNDIGHAISDKHILIQIYKKWKKKCKICILIDVHQSL